MTVRAVMVCEACQRENHDACAQGACICAIRGHDYQPRIIETPRYIPPQS